MNNTSDLRRYDYGDYTPLSSRCEQLKEYLDSKLSGIDSEHISDTIHESIDENMCDVKQRLCHTNCHIETAKNEIMEKVEQGRSQCEAFHNEAKEEIANAVDKVNEHIDSKFSDLNEQIKSFNNLNLGEYNAH